MLKHHAITLACAFALVTGVVGLFADAQAEYHKGAQAYVNHDYASAEKHFQAAINEQPDFAAAHLYLGHTYFFEQKYKEAIPEYEKVQEIDSKMHKLTKNDKRLLTDQLGMSYGISGQLDKAKQLFASAIKDDPDYPLFYYNLACAYAELGDLDNAITNLKAGFDRKQNMLGNEQYPDARKDDSFKRYVANPKFVAAMKQMGYE